MFDIGTNRLSRAAAELLVEVGGAISTLPNPIAMRGHTDSLPYNPRPGTPQGMNNWILSSQRAEATRAMLAANGVDPTRFARLEGVADRSEEHTSELQSLMRISYAVFCLKKKITSRPSLSNDRKNYIRNTHTHLHR